jgi:hypothetical protein
MGKSDRKIGKAVFKRCRAGGMGVGQGAMRRALAQSRAETPDGFSWYLQA